MKDAPSSHSGHRRRLRERFELEPRAASDHEILELLLTYVHPRKDTKPLAKELITRFGSLGEALLADPCRIGEIPGLGPATEAFWRTLRECRARAACRPVAEREKFSSPEQVRDMVCARLGNLTKEEFWVILVDNQNRLIRFERVFRGTVDQTAAYPREILELALRLHASGLILVHNHPGGDPAPSAQDRNLTETVGRLAGDLGLRLLDHLIVTSDSFTSFRTLGLI